MSGPASEASSFTVSSRTSKLPVRTTRSRSPPRTSAGKTTGLRVRVYCMSMGSGVWARNLRVKGLAQTHCPSAAGAMVAGAGMARLSSGTARSNSTAMAVRMALSRLTALTASP